MPKEIQVSIVIALYNKEKYVRACIQSVLHQSYSNIIVYVIDDGSTDNSLMNLADINDDRLHIIKQKNQGPGVARNKGLSLTNTPYVTFIDADDTWHEDFIKDAVTALQNNVQCDLFLCAAYWEPQHELRIPYLNNENPSDSATWNLKTNYNAYETFDVVNFFATGAVLAKTDIIKKYKGYFDITRCNSGEDGFLWLQVMYNHTIYRTTTPYLYVNTEGSDLGIGRVSIKPTPPWITHSSIIMNNCPTIYQPSFIEYLNYTAFTAFRRAIYQGKIAQCIKLLFNFPALVKYKTKDYPPILWALIKFPIRHNLSRIYQKIKNI
jgi:glycosyltransferase involved in cell wall biosynthesis